MPPKCGVVRPVELKPDSKLTGIFIKDETSADVDDVMLSLDDACNEAMRRERGRQRLLESTARR